MKRSESMIKFGSLLLAILLFTSAIFGFSGCKNTSTTSATPLGQDVSTLKTLASKMYCTTIMAKDKSVAGQLETEVDATVTNDEEGNTSLALKLTLTDDLWYDFTNSGNSFKVQHEELGLPYYCAKAYIYQSASGGYAPYDFAVDFEKGYLIFKESTNITTFYVVASSDPEVDPMEITEHFATFFRIYDYNALNEEPVTDFYFDLYGTWLSEDCEVLGEMDFYVTGTLPEKYKDGDEVEMELNFIWPESSGYRNEGKITYTGRVDVFEDHHNHPNFHGMGTLYNSQTGEQISFVYNIFPYDFTVIMYLNGQYLIGNLRQTTQARSQLNYYKEFIFTTP